ncbi:hypothetical protein [Colwellia sp.]|nr:hypothetical protein [Colwellia sp.]
MSSTFQLYYHSGELAFKMKANKNDEITPALASDSAGTFTLQ